MFITRATRHDRSDIADLLKVQGWDDADVTEGHWYIARAGGVVGCVQLVEVGPQRSVVDNVLVHPEHRGTGVGDALMKAAMNARGGTLFLCCHDDKIAYYERFGFTTLDISECPDEVVDYWRKVDDYPTPEGHVHHFMKAR
ncbi:MAG TPA: GNAT family N-acetyltransferase [Actinomycetota bacterium]|jgi:N-acetylglutamate synthase-like GNAT family acetyltransferase|nr:GNAT family N-acetyltransferase [Actinomycetota bacterium]